MKKRDKAPGFSERVIRKEAKLKLATQYAIDTERASVRSQFRKWIKAALRLDAEIVLRIVDETEGRTLNRDFRGRDYATNVLTFVYRNVRPLCGDIVLCAPVVEEEARQQHKSLAAHYAHLTVHGALHLQGYDHESDAAAVAMEQLETEIMARLGHNDPYKECQPAIGEF